MLEWERVTLGEVVTPVHRTVEVKPGTAYRTLGVRWWGAGAYERQTIDGSQTAAKTLSIVHKDDLIINKIWVRHGSTAIAGQDVHGCAASNEFPTFELDRSRVIPEWLHYLTQTREFWSCCDALSQGTSGKNRIKPEKFLTIEIPLPPLPEQQRIVARVKGLLDKVEEARRLRENTIIETQNLIQSLRNEVFSQLSMTLPPRRLDEVASVQLGKMLSEKAKTGLGTTPYLRNANIKWDALDLSSIYTMDFDDREREKFNLQYGDILMCEGGNIGQSAMWRDEIPGCCYQKALHRIRRLDDTLLPEFLLQHLFWAAETGQFHDAKTQTTIAHLPAVKLKAQTVFVPEVGEQRAIIQKLLSEQEKLNALRAVQNQSSTEVQALPSAILAQAFAGAL